MEKSYKQMSREERGEDIVKRFQIVKTPRGWRVPSTSHSGSSYLVTFNGHEPKCTCADCELRKQKCKHIHAVEFYIKKEIDEEGKITQTKGVKITYSQDWKAYDKAQTNEKLFFLKLLRDLCNNIEQQKYKFGRPKLPFEDLIFASALKVYSTFSLRRFMSDLKIAKEMNLINSLPCYSSISHFMEREDITDILKELISISASPLREVETSFAADSSGFSTSRFARWYDTKWGKERKFKVWIKAHLISGVKTNIITGCEITEGHESDSPQLSNLVEQTAKNFKVGEVSCDKAYSSRANLELIENVGAVPFIPFKKNTSGNRVKNRTLGTWGRMYHYFMYRHEEFLEHYHKRSNAETIFNKAIKLLNEDCPIKSCEWCEGK